MNERKDEKWLNNQLQRAINGSTPTFDAGAWKQEYGQEYRLLLSRGGRSNPRVAGTGRTIALVFKTWSGRLALAAAVLVTIGILLAIRPGHTLPRGLPAVAKSPAEMVTVMSLQAAYRQGGTEALDRQFDKALKLLGPRTTSMSLKELLGS